MRYVVSVNGETHIIDLEENGHLRELTLDQRQMALDWRLIGRALAAPYEGDTRADQYSLLIEDQSYVAYARLLDETVAEETPGRKVEVLVHGVPYVVEVQDARSLALASLAGGAHASGEATIRAPMPGLVSNVLVSVGDEVHRGQTIVVLEAMKMENDLTTPRSGQVRTIPVAKGQTISQDDVLATIGDPLGMPAPEEVDE
jgi:biotin carboxyl carrier protein